NALAVVAPAWLQPHLRPAWVERYGPRLEEYRLPKDRMARQALAETIGADGYAVLTAVYGPAAPGWLRELPAVETLRQVWVQQYQYGAPAQDQDHAPASSPAPRVPAEEGQVRLRTTAEAPAPAGLLHSPYDPQ